MNNTEYSANRYAITLLLAHGANDTRKNDATSEYDGISFAQIAQLVDKPQAVEKDQAAFIIPSSYRAHDGRSHAVQRENGSFHMLCVDVDYGSPSMMELRQAIESATGNAHCFIYSSASSSHDEHKWRVLIPLKEPIDGQDFSSAQLALFDLLENEHGVICDKALSRTGQPVFLPNVPPNRRDEEGNPFFYHGVKHRGDAYLDLLSSRIGQNMAFLKRQQEVAALRAKEERIKREQQRLDRGYLNQSDTQPLEEFNRRHSISSLLNKYEYEQAGRGDSYRSRYQTSGSYATKDFGDYWVSLSTSDANAGVGQVKQGDITYCWGDAFDLYCHYEFNGDFKRALRSYAEELNPKDYTKQREAALEAANSYSQVDFDDFEYIPDATLAGEIEKAEAQTIIPNKGIFWARDARAVLTSSYLVKGWLGAGQMSVVYGPSNVGKSFFCLDVAFAIAGNIAWRGSKVRGGPVLYLATEGGNAFHNRVVALRSEYGIDDVPLAVRPSPVDLLRPEVDLANLILLCKSIEVELGRKLSMIVVDTLSRAMAGGNENGPEDMGAFIANIDALRDVTEAHIMVIHHTGKDTAQGARGHSSLRAATDTEIELELMGDMRSASATKQRDLEPARPVIFSLKVHELGEDEDGDKVTTCTIQQADAETVEDMKQRRPSGKNQKILAEAFKQMRGERVGAPNPGGAGYPDAGKYWTIDEEKFKDFAQGKMTGANTRTAYKNALDALLACGYMVMNQGKVWIAAKEGKV